MDPVELALDANAVKFVAAACMTLLLYDYAITFDEEYNCMWPSRLSVPKVLFFLNRYIVGGMLVFNAIASSRSYLHPSFCVFFLRWLAVTTTVQCATVQGILVMRVWALHRKNKIVLATALSFYFGGIFTLIGLTIQDYVGEVVAINEDLSHLPGCYATSVPSIIGGFWITPLVIESILFLLVITRAFFWWRAGSSGSKILELLARDSTLYFFIIFLLLVANFLMFHLGPPFLASLLVTPCNTAGCLLGSHLLLNIRTLNTNVTPNNNGSSFQAGEPSQVHRGPPSNGVRPFIQARNALNGLANKSIRSVSPYICDLEAYGTSKDDSGGVQSEGGIELPDTEEKQNHEFRDSDSTLDKQSVIDSRIDSPIRFIQELPSVKKKLASSLTDLRIVPIQRADGSSGMTAYQDVTSRILNRGQPRSPDSSRKLITKLSLSTIAYSTSPEANHQLGGALEPPEASPRSFFFGSPSSNSHDDQNNVETCAMSSSLSDLGHLDVATSIFTQSSSSRRAIPGRMALQTTPEYNRLSIHVRKDVFMSVDVHPTSAPGSTTNLNDESSQASASKGRKGSEMTLVSSKIESCIIDPSLEEERTARLERDA